MTRKTRPTKMRRTCWAMTSIQHSLTWMKRTDGSRRCSSLRRSDETPRSAKSPSEGEKPDSLRLLLLRAPRRRFRRDRKVHARELEAAALVRHFRVYFDLVERMAGGDR